MKRYIFLAMLLALFSLAIAQTGYIVPRVMINPGAPKVQIEPYAYVVDIEGNKYYPVMTITDNATSTSTLRLKDGNDEACIVDWTGNGDLQVISADVETESSVIPSVVTIYSRTRTLSYFKSTNNNFYWTDVDVPVSLAYLILGSSDSYGSLSDLPNLTQLTFLSFFNTNIIVDVSYLSGLTNLTYLKFGGTSTTGDISNLSGLTNLTYLYFVETDVTYTSATLPNWDNCDIFGTSCNWTETMVDAFLADLDASSVSSTKSVNIAGTNAPPSDPVGLASVASLEAKGWTVTVTAQP